MAWAKAHSDELVRYIRAFIASLDWLYDPTHRNEALGIYVRHTHVPPNVAEQMAAIALEPSSGLFRRARFDVDGARSVLDLRNRYATPARQLTHPLSYYDPSYYERAPGDT